MLCGVCAWRGCGVAGAWRIVSVRGGNVQGAAASLVLNTPAPFGQNDSAIVNSPQTLLALAVAMLLASSLLGVLNGSKVKTLRNEMNSAVTQKQTAERQRAAADKEMRTRETKVAEQMAKMTETDSRVAGSEADLV